jgi:hypothetical protein
MKKDNDNTWLGFFKKILKFTGFSVIAVIVVIIIVIVWVLYNERNEEKIGTTYLKCEKNYLAFDDRYIYSQWDGLENDWEISLDITKKNKRVVEAEFKFEDGKGMYVIDRINGTIELKDSTKDKTLFKRNCIKIQKTDLPESKEEPKF